MTEHLYKYPRTPHLPFSQGATSDDKHISKDALDFLKSGVELVVSEKLDGGNVTMYRNAFHARSLTSGTHAWDTKAKALHAQIRHEIPEGWRISGESMYARRSIHYNNLSGVFIVFGIWNDNNVLLSWDEMIEWCSLLELPFVPLLYKGTDYEQAISAWGQTLNEESSEGFVLRYAGEIAYEDFPNKIAKWVRKGHVQTSDDWRGRTDFALNSFLNDEESPH